MRTFVLRSCLSVGLLNVLFSSTATGDQNTASEMEGIWKLTQYTVDGHASEEMLKQKCRLVIKDGVQETFENGKSRGKSKITITGESYPKDIEYTSEKGEKSLGLITMHVFMYVVTLSDPEKRKTERPSSFQDENTIRSVYERMTEDEIQAEKKLSLTRNLGGRPSSLAVLPAYQLERDKPFQKSLEIRMIESAYLLVPIKVPIAIDHRIEIVKCTTSDKSVMVPIEIVHGAPGLKGDEEAQSLTLLLKILKKGKATIDVDIKYNANHSPKVQYDFSIVE